MDPEFRAKRALAKLAKHTTGISSCNLMRVVTTTQTKVFLTDNITLNTRLWDKTVSDSEIQTFIAYLTTSPLS